MIIEHVQTKREIEATLEAAGFSPRKRFGQHFLIDGNLMRRLVESAELQPQDFVLEVGGGTGGLTDLLVGKASQVLCAEIDRGLHGILQNRLRGATNLSLVHDDVLHGKHALAPSIGQWLKEAEPKNGGAIKLVSNLPYQIASPLLMDLLVDFSNVKRLCFTVQAEVGDRILSPPGCKAYGPLSIVIQALCHGETIAQLPPHVFWPRPGVDSVMLRLDRKSIGPFSDVDELRRFTRLVRGVFDHRRKTLRGALGFALDAKTLDRALATVNGTRRPEELEVAEWLAVFRSADVDARPGEKDAD
ncbi:MAG: 16S rRNA (adenine(1518)-N(6)/adenine(1519)-N(6))-dimethyltransferase RsmA [Planctomycetota bacterium]